MSIFRHTLDNFHDNLSFVGIIHSLEPQKQGIRVNNNLQKVISEGQKMAYKVPPLEVKTYKQYFPVEANRYSRSIVKWNCSDITFYSTLVREGKWKHDDCFLYVSHHQVTDQIRLGFAEEVNSCSFPFKPKNPLYVTNIPFKDLEACPKTDKNVLKMQSKDGEKVRFQFVCSKIMNEWVILLVDLQCLNNQSKKPSLSIYKFDKASQNLYLTNPSSTCDLVSLEELQDKNKRYKKELKSQKQELNQKHQIFKQVTDNTRVVIEKLDEDKTSLQAEVDKLTKQINRKAETLSQKEARRLTNQLLLSQVQEQNRGLVMSLKDMKEQIQQKQSKALTLNRELDQLQIKLQDSLNEADFLKNQNTQLKGQIQQLKRPNSSEKKSELKILTLEGVIARLEIQNKQLVGRVQALEEGKRLVEQNHRKQLQKLVAQLNETNQKLSNKTNSKAHPSQSIEQLELRHIVDGPTLSQRLQHKKFIRRAIEQQEGKRIVQTRLLYTFDRQNKVSFHTYIDNYPHLVLVIRLKTGWCLAAYTESPFTSGQVADKEGLIIAINKQKVYRSKSGKKAITYDDYYLIFGNSEVRIKAQEAKVFSNFGIANSFYEHGGDKVGVLLGEGTERQVELDMYELHHVQFQS